MKKKLLNIAVCLIVLASAEVRAQDTCRVALMVPLYLEQVDQAFYDAEPENQMLKSKPFSFLHFYEGFMIAADSIVNSHGMSLEIKVYDVDNNVSKADTAVADPWLTTANLIVGPFYLKPFNVVKQFAWENDIPIVNPITQRSDIVDYQYNVIKAKPSMFGQIAVLDSLISKKYHNNNIFIIRENDDCDMSIIEGIYDMALARVDSCSYVANKHIVDVIKKHHRRLKYLKVEYEANAYKTDHKSLDINELKSYIEDSTAFENHVLSVNYQQDSLYRVEDYISTMRNNLFIVYGDNKIFANEIVNKVTKLVENYPITVIMLPSWSKFDKLFNDNLMKMKAIYFEDNYIDYQNIRVESFICKFRNRYEAEPSVSAFQGFDIGWYFLNALYIFDEFMLENLPEFDIPLLSTKFSFKQTSEKSGLENTYWNVYQFKGYNKVVIDYAK